MTIVENIQRIETAKADIREAIISKGIDLSKDVTIDGYAKYINEFLIADNYTGNLAIALGRYKDVNWEWDTRNTSPFTDTVENFNLSPYGGDYRIFFTCTEEISHYSLHYNIGHTDGSTEYNVEPFTGLIPTTPENQNNGLVDDTVFSNTLFFDFYIGEKPSDVWYREMNIAIWTDDGQGGQREHDITLMQSN